MAASVGKWFCDELSKLGIDATEENAQYILSMDDAEDLQEYMLNLLDGSDPAVQAFLPRLMDRWCTFGGRPPPNVTVYKKEEQPQVYVQPKGKKKKGKNKAGTSQSPASISVDPSTTCAPLESPRMNGDSSSSASLVNGPASTPSEQVNRSSLKLIGQTLVGDESKPVENGEVCGGSQLGQGAKKKSKFVPLYSQQGKEKLVIKLPGRTQCECQALKHKLVNNCVSCGRVVCEQEGAGPCLFCGNLICTPEDQEVLNRGSKKSEKLRQHLMRDADKFTPLCTGGGEREVLSSVAAHMQQGLSSAVKHKDRLLEYDKTSVRRTQVIDDECDYFATDSNQWLSKQERDKLRKREEELRSARFQSRRDRKVTLDFAGRQVVEEADMVGQTMYDHRDSVVQEVQYGRATEGRQGSHADADTGEAAYLVNPSIVQPAPQFVSSRKGKKAGASGVPARSKVGVIQDRELQEMTDEGMCLSMHQPWASLLVAGIKIHEGRSWYTAHRGRLWIAATAKMPSSEEISEMERHYELQYKGTEVDFPADYPSGCLLGAVDLVDCLPQEDYRQKFPDGESICPYVFICENPQQLLIKFPIKGKHKIYKLDPTIHQAAKKGLR